MTNTKFLAIRKCYGFEWEAYRDTSCKSYLAVCHAFSKTVTSKTWDGLWEEILFESKSKRKNQRNFKKNSKKDYKKS